MSTPDAMRSAGVSPAAAGELRHRLVEALRRDVYAVQRGNTDYWRYQIGALGQIRTRVRETVVSVLGRLGLSPSVATPRVEALAHTFEHIEDFERTYQRLGDGYSRDMLLAVLRFRILGKQRVRLPRNDAAYWTARKNVNRQLRRQRNTMRGPWNWQLHLYEPVIAGSAIRLHGDMLDVLHTCVLEQYAYRRGGRQIEARPGDVAIDGGGCSGDTALYLAARTAPSGRVFSFEFNPENLEIFDRNRELNPALASRVEVVPNALWDVSGETIAYTPNGAGTTLLRSADSQAEQVTTLTIDDLVAQHSIDRVDFIKFDIEGAELRALRGAERTLQAHRPRLAVTVYHQPQDLYEIPDFLDGLGLGYEFYLDHFTIYDEETVLFAEVPG